jgi:hypothetical protein
MFNVWRDPCLSAAADKKGSSAIKHMQVFYGMCNDVVPGILKDGLRVQECIPIDQSFRVLLDVCLCCLGDQRSPELSGAWNARFGECSILCRVLPFYLSKSSEVVTIHDELRVCALLWSGC